MKLLALIIFQRSLLKQFLNIKKVGYNNNELLQFAFLVVNSIKVDNFAFLFNCTVGVQASDSMKVPI